MRRRHVAGSKNVWARFVRVQPATRFRWFVVMERWDRKRVKRVCRYLARPPIATERLTEVGGELRYELKKVWRDGTRFVMLDPYELLARMCAMVPPPWFNMIRFHGVLGRMRSYASKWSRRQGRTFHRMRILRQTRCNFHSLGNCSRNRT